MGVTRVDATLRQMRTHHIDARHTAGFRLTALFPYLLG